MDRIDKFIYINLVKREDRRKHIEDELKEYLNKNPDISECIDCIECDDASTILIE